ncbi:hypothetical protein HK096_002549 [Nowakowskiella sp. JEL0078]|nr:hypothetical protein HK096_002549 [Nowakowskiella sp. JEL0078]
MDGSAPSDLFTAPVSISGRGTPDSQKTTLTKADSFFSLYRNNTQASTTVSKWTESSNQEIEKKINSQSINPISSISATFQKDSYQTAKGFQVPMNGISEHEIQKHLPVPQPIVPDFVNFEYMERKSLPWYRRQVCGCLPVWILLVIIILFFLAVGIVASVVVPLTIGSTNSSSDSGNSTSPSSITSSRSFSESQRTVSGSATTATSPSPLPTPSPIVLPPGATRGFSGGLTQKDSEVSSLIYSDTSSRLMVGGKDGILREYNASGSLIRLYSSSSTSAIVFTKILTDGTIFTASSDGSVNIFSGSSVSSNVNTKILPTRQGANVFTSTSNLLTSGVSDSGTKVYFTSSGSPPTLFEYDTSALTSVSFPGTTFKAIGAAFYSSLTGDGNNKVIVGDSTGTFWSASTLNKTFSTILLSSSGSAVIGMTSFGTLIYASTADLITTKYTLDPTTSLMNSTSFFSGDIAGSGLSLSGGKLYTVIDSRILPYDTATVKPGSSIGPFTTTVTKVAVGLTSLFVGCADGVVYQFPAQ